MGLPILTSIIECNKVRKNGVWIIADGGIRSTGDIAKAIYFGADFCMIGKLLASTNLATGTCFNKDKEEIINCPKSYWEGDPEEATFMRPIYPEEFQKMLKLAKELDKTNFEATKGIVTREQQCINHLVAYKGYHGMASRQARENILSYAGVEGAEGLIRYSGTTFDFIADTRLRLQSALSYAGARNWTEFRKKTKAYRRSNSSIVAADVHLDVLTRLH